MKSDLSLFSCVFDKPLLTGSLDYPVEPLSQRLSCLGHLQVDVNPSLCLVTEGDGGPGQALPALPAALVAVHPDQSIYYRLMGTTYFPGKMCIMDWPSAWLTGFLCMKQPG